MEKKFKFTLHLLDEEIQTIKHLITSAQERKKKWEEAGHEFMASTETKLIDERLEKITELRDAINLLSKMSDQQDRTL